MAAVLLLLAPLLAASAPPDACAAAALGTAARGEVLAALAAGRGCAGAVAFAGPVDLLLRPGGPLRAQLPAGAGEVPCHLHGGGSTEPAVRVAGLLLGGRLLAVRAPPAAGPHAAPDAAPDAGRPVWQQAAPPAPPAVPYAVGRPTLLAATACPEDRTLQQCADDEFTGVIAASYGRNATRWLEAAVAEAAAFLAAMSGGRLRLQPTVVRPVRVPGYTTANCGRLEAIRHLDFRPDLTGIDGLLIRQLRAELGVDRARFDLFAYTCGCRAGHPYLGIGWIGAAGLMVRHNERDGLDASLVHELGHNLGLSHAGRLAGGAAGRDVAAATFADQLPGSASGGGGWPDGFLEYGSPLSDMGAAPPPGGHFEVSAKRMLGWLPPGAVAVLPLDAACDPACGPYELWPADLPEAGAAGADPARPPAALVGLELATAHGRALFAEVRVRLAGGGGAPALALHSARPGQFSVAVLLTTVLADAGRPGPAGFAVPAGASVRVELGGAGRPAPAELAVARGPGSALRVTVTRPRPPGPPGPPRRPGAAAAGPRRSFPSRGRCCGPA